MLGCHHKERLPVWAAGVGGEGMRAGEVWMVRQGKDEMSAGEVGMDGAQGGSIFSSITLLCVK